MPRSSRRGTRVNTERVAKMETLLYRLDSELNRTVSNSCGNPVCVFITAGPLTKLCAWGRRRVEDMCYEIRRANVFSAEP